MINQLIREVVDSFQLRAEQTGFKIDFDCGDEVLPVKTEPQNLTIILHNLIDNALKYTKTPSPKVFVLATLESNMLTISVMDNGKSIGEENKFLIFDQFYRIPRGDVHDEKGHGLGLYIVSQLVKSLHGTIKWIAKHDGNNFELKIPVEYIR